MCLPDSPPELHPTEVTSEHSIIPCDETNGENFIKLIKSHYIYNGLQSIPMIDLDQLEQAVIKFYIAGKPLIINDSSIRTIFRFRNSPNETTVSGHK